MDDAIFKFIGEAIKGGYAIPFIVFYIWDKWNDRKESKKLDEKKKSGEYVSFEEVRELKEDLRTLDGKFNSHIAEEAEKDARMIKVEMGHDHLKENIMDIKSHLQELKDNQKDIFRLVSETKNLMIQKM